MADKDKSNGSDALSAARKAYNAAVRRARANPHNKDAAAEIIRARKRLNQAALRASQ